MVLVMFLEVSEEEYRKERSEQYNAECNMHALEGCKVTGKRGKLIPCRKKNCDTCERCYNGNVISIEAQYEEYQNEFASEDNVEEEYARRSVNEAFHKAIEELKGDDYKIIQLVLKKNPILKSPISSDIRASRRYSIKEPRSKQSLEKS
jgi:hypothetical protein